MEALFLRRGGRIKMSGIL